MIFQERPSQEDADIFLFPNHRCELIQKTAHPIYTSGEDYHPGSQRPQDNRRPQEERRQDSDSHVWSQHLFLSQGICEGSFQEIINDLQDIKLPLFLAGCR